MKRKVKRVLIKENVCLIGSHNEIIKNIPIIKEIMQRGCTADDTPPVTSGVYAPQKNRIYEENTGF